MQIYTLDYIVRNYLLKQGYSLHWYLQGLLHAVDCLVDLHFDALRVVNTRILPVNSYNAADLPEGYTDCVGVFIKNGQKLQPLTENNSINPLNNYDSNLNIQRWDNPTTNSSNDQSVVQVNGLLNTWYFGFAPYDSLGEPLGRFSGIGNPTTHSYTIVKERNQIQLDEGLSVTEIVLQWVGDGRNSDAVTSVESYAVPAIRQYIKYKLKDCNRSYSRNEVEYEYQKYITEMKKLRGRKSDLTITSLRQIIYRNTRLSASK